MYKAVLSYDGTRYFGWQKTATGPSVQEEVAKAIAQITQEAVLPEAASRTDKGVHAEGQVVQFALEKAVEIPRLQRGLNAVLPDDIRIIDLLPFQFHPTLDALGKEYHYRLCLDPVQDPIHRLYSWHVPYPLSREKMELAATDLVGTLDFTALANDAKKTPICTIESIQILSIDRNRLEIRIRGNRFLYKMARNIAGSLVYVGYGKLRENSLPEILASRDRKKAGITAPAHGLHLHQVFYPVK